MPIPEKTAPGYTTKLSGFKSFRIQSSHLKLRIQNLRRHDKTQGSFYLGFVHLGVNSKTNPVLKRPGFVTNPEQFLVV